VAAPGALRLRKREAAPGALGVSGVVAWGLGPGRAG
jgi:hypothetical protein